ncbi:MAG: glycosyl transferase [Alphaproteobacteria bacterium]|nr:glycosyl transferase [Alphaproteobacteria bacterium]
MQIKKPSFLRRLSDFIKYIRLRARRIDENLPEKDIRFILGYRFRRAHGYDLNLDNPRSYSEKIQWLKFYYHDSLITLCADKYRAREYIADAVGPQYLVDLIGVYRSADEIDFDKLPEQFVLKVNWGCKQNIICRSKKDLDVAKAREKLRKWTRPAANIYFRGFEWGYKNIVPRIICEKYIPEMDKGGTEYEFFCFNGKPVWIMLRGFDEQGRHISDEFDLNFKRMPFKKNMGRSTGDIKKPKEFKEMLELCKKLAEPFPLVRINIIKLKTGLKIGELTFTPGSGLLKFHPEEWDFKLGEMLKLPDKI